MSRERLHTAYHELVACMDACHAVALQVAEQGAPLELRRQAWKREAELTRAIEGVRAALSAIRPAFAPH